MEKVNGSPEIVGFLSAGAAAIDEAADAHRAIIVGAAPAAENYGPNGRRSTSRGSSARASYAAAWVLGTATVEGTHGRTSRPWRK